MTRVEGLVVREIGAQEFHLLWPIFLEVIAAGDTYTYPPDMPFDEARRLWTGGNVRCFLAEIGRSCVGGYMLHPNQPGLGNHVAHGGYMVAAAARGRGIASALCMHSLDRARRAGFTAMQFNCVVSTNEVAVRLWQKHGFSIVGRVPNAFRHSRDGLVDVFVMHRFL
ncbi:MAG TPA: GNAT family N-acetyltransferase [Rudaea sp.]|jgi:ribosomal protein S18 acetylase RimI-like enzyme